MVVKLAAAVIGLACLLVSIALPAQVYDNPENLKVLPKDITADGLRETMKGFALGTGLRCSDCHVGEEGQPLTSYDFASDEKDLKQTARLMLRMTRSINEEKLAPLGEDHVQVQCVTCHRGLRKPRTTAQELEIAAEKGGVEGLQSRYRELHERYYGTHSYDFSVFLLGEFARSRTRAGKPQEALAMLDILAEEHPDSYWVQFLYGETLESTGDIDGAISRYRTSVELQPDSTGWIRKRIESLEASSKGAAPVKD